MKMLSGVRVRYAIWIIATVVFVMTLLFIDSRMVDAAVTRSYMLANPGREVTDIWVNDGDSSLVDVCIVYLDKAGSNYGASICVFKRTGFLDCRLLVQEDAVDIVSRPTNSAEVFGSRLIRKHPHPGLHVTQQ
jgi:hypothetical protein